ncbi:MAG: hypothetical protein KA010_01640 [Saprospiraceae bacterium]|nr:hypothetical protein [Saprospiraceae bacterium]
MAKLLFWLLTIFILYYILYKPDFFKHISGVGKQINNNKTEKHSEKKEEGEYIDYEEINNDQ